MPNPRSKIAGRGCAARLENDPFASIVECCVITDSAEEILRTCDFSDQLKVPVFAGKTVPPVSSDAGQYVTCNASTGVDPGKAVDLGKDKDSSVPMDYEMAPEIVSEIETENYRFVKRVATSDNPNASKRRCDSSEPRVVRGPGQVQNGQNCSIEDDQRLPKKKIDVLSVLKEIAEHQKSCNSVPKKSNGLTFPRPKWWSDNYEDMV